MEPAAQGPRLWGLQPPARLHPLIQHPQVILPPRVEVLHIVGRRPLAHCAFLKFQGPPLLRPLDAPSPHVHLFASGPVRGILPLPLLLPLLLLLCLLVLNLLVQTAPLDIELFYVFDEVSLLVLELVAKDCQVIRDGGYQQLLDLVHAIKELLLLSVHLLVALELFPAPPPPCLVQEVALPHVGQLVRAVCLVRLCTFLWLERVARLCPHD
mmetsp:Transcript_892/g.2217  ORF Transcript_892/g.2217 Transcript_892/m.2217 type:complete len:211 (+) Transcript_892:297-929(+)